MKSYYNAVFGVSEDVKAFPSGTTNFTVGKGNSYLTASGPNGRLYWFLFTKLPRPLCGKDTPRYTKDDEVSLVQKHWQDKITEDVTLGDVYENRTSSILVPLQEVTFDKWHFQRIITFGDSVSKVSKQLRDRDS